MKREVMDKMRERMTALFTIEQFELVRRLRASGMTKDQVALAFDKFDQLEWDLQVGGSLLRNSGGRVNSVASSSPPQVNGGRTPLHVRDQERNTSSEKEHSHAPHHHPNGNGTNGEQNGRPKSSAQSACSVSSNEDSSATEGREQMTPPLQLTLAPPHKSPPPHRASTDSSTSLLPPVLTPSETDRENLQAAAALMASWPLMAPTPSHGPPLTPNGNGSTPNGHLGVVPLQAPMSRAASLSVSGESTGTMAPYLPEDYCPPDVEELKRKGEEALLSEIRNFVMRYNIKQTMIAEMTKMSQAYVSRFFRGDIADMSERTKNTFYMWYLTCKNNPWKLAPHPGVKRMVSENGDLIPLKRERFTFKSAHLAVLERYYERDPYPDAQTREQIVEECNVAVERPDRPLADREKVTLPVVNNWFNNRRKEAKKQLRQQHAAMAAAAAAQQESPPPPAFAALQQQLGWQLIQSSALAIAGAAGQSGSPPPQTQPGISLPNHPGLAGMAALAAAPHSVSAMEDDDDDSRGSYSIPEETMAIDFSEGGAAARENRESRDSASTTPANTNLSCNELSIKQEAVS
ncbi:hepatocyte nuclear factor 1-beta-like isoform X3 [Varroa destructor]|uniref:Uncharacterized protein n=1 Tax=Varroa destructor TaxID=109461 RepID=A0A7M7JH59_VARDE|nr:hepatocyte nuclear factor 1-beta-like isoform X3 [Varroa destructor]